MHFELEAWNFTHCEIYLLEAELYEIWVKDGKILLFIKSFLNNGSKDEAKITQIKQKLWKQRTIPKMLWGSASILSITEEEVEHKLGTNCRSAHFCSPQNCSQTGEIWSAA